MLKNMSFTFFSRLVLLVAYKTKRISLISAGRDVKARLPCGLRTNERHEEEEEEEGEFIFERSGWVTVFDNIVCTELYSLLSAHNLSLIHI